MSEAEQRGGPYAIALRPVAAPPGQLPPGADARVLGAAPRGYQAELVAPTGRTPSLAWEREGSALALLDGYLLEGPPLPRLLAEFRRAGSGPQRPLPGIYTLLLIDLDRGRLELSNDASGSFPCFQRRAGDELLLSNSLAFLRRLRGLAICPQGFGERYALCWSIGDKTPLQGVRRAPPGSRLAFDLARGEAPRRERLARTWSRVDARPSRVLIPALRHRWRQAVARCLGVVSGTPGLMLSGGLDSRLVLAELVAQGSRPLACTHGDPRSQELAIAARVAATAGVELLRNPMDTALGMGDLDLPGCFAGSGLLFNPIWGRSLALLARRGVRQVFTGCLGDVLLGGSYVAPAARAARFGRNLLAALRLPGLVRLPSRDRVREEFPWRVHAQARKRLRHYGRLLRPELQELCREALARVPHEVARVLDRYAGEGHASGTQWIERFRCEHRDRQYVFGQELAVRARGEPLLPTLDRDLLELLTNLDPRLKTDHALYYRFLRAHAPAMAAVEVPGLHGSAAAPQLLLELRRAAGAVFPRRGPPRSWVNFQTWALAGGRLDALAAEFLRLDQVFDPDAVRAHFAALRRGERRLYDGNETLHFLACGWLLGGAPDAA